MNRRFRLNKQTDFERVRRNGPSFSHPLLVLITLPNELEISRFGVSAGRSVGGAVQRNRAKRRLRAALARLVPAIRNGYDLVFLARKPIQASSGDELYQAVRELLERSGLLKHSHDC